MALFVDVTATSHVGHDQYNPVEEKGGEESGGEIGLLVAGERKSEETGGGGIIGEEESVKMKQKLVSKVLEIGIIFHSVIIGVTMGMSQNQCTIKPLVAALAFHQIFEGMGLGGCIAQVSRSSSFFLIFLFSFFSPLKLFSNFISRERLQVLKSSLFTIDVPQLLFNLLNI